MWSQHRVGLFEAMGVNNQDVLEMAGASDATIRVATPSLVRNPADDVFGDERLACEVADQLGAQFAVLESSGHFWPYSAPSAGAGLLIAFWDTLPDPGSRT